MDKPYVVRITRFKVGDIVYYHGDAEYYKNKSAEVIGIHYSSLNNPVRLKFKCGGIVHTSFSRVFNKEEQLKRELDKTL